MSGYIPHLTGHSPVPGPACSDYRFWVSGAFPLFFVLLGVLWNVWQKEGLLFKLETRVYIIEH